MTTQAVGLALPAIRASGGYFTSKNPYDTAWGDLLIALLCPYGARPMRRRFGSQLSASMFGPNDSSTRAAIDQSIRATAAASVPSIRIIDVRVVSDATTVSIAVSFTLTNETLGTEVRERLLKLDRRNVVQFLSVRPR